jgi:two-component system OmpR family sensor kinase
MTGGRRWLAWAALAYLAILATVALGLRHQYAGARQRLDEALGQRLLGVASTVAALSDGERIFYASLGDSSSSAYLADLAETCRRIRRTENLAEITITDPLDERILLTTSSGLRPGEKNLFWRLDAAATELAAAGQPVATRLYELPSEPGAYQKSAHAPVFKFFGETRDPVAVVTVSASPDFFDALRTLRRGALATGLVVLVILTALGGVLWRVNTALQRARATALRQESLAAMGRMTAGIAHEIRNPLGIIRGAGQHAQRALAQAGLDDEIAGFIPDEVDRLDRILSGYLALGADRPAEAEVFALDEQVRRGLRLAADELAAAQVSLVAEDLAPGLQVRGDPRRLQQVLLNLVLNGRDAAGTGGAVTVAAARAGDRIRLTVRDDGPGLGGRDPEKLFEPFVTDKEKGSGLGLAISRRIIEDMQGALTLADAPDGRGAVATVELPPARNEEG